jgi:hypothetical protein
VLNNESVPGSNMHFLQILWNLSLSVNAGVHGYNGVVYRSYIKRHFKIHFTCNIYSFLGSVRTESWWIRSNWRDFVCRVHAANARPCSQNPWIYTTLPIYAFTWYAWNPTKLSAISTIPNACNWIKPMHAEVRTVWERSIYVVFSINYYTFWSISLFSTSQPTK